MLLSVFLPFSDLRSLTVPGFSYLDKPSWPFPSPGTDYVRGMGSIHRRKKRGFAGWVGEDRIAVGGKAFKITLPRLCRSEYADYQIGLVRKSCYFDGVANGRFEIVFRVGRAAGGVVSCLDNDELNTILRFISEVPVKSKLESYSGILKDSSDLVGSIWARATVKNGHAPHAQAVFCSNPLFVFETETPVFGWDRRRRGLGGHFNRSI